jgi:hypothetical protein
VSSKHRKIHAALFEEPTRADIAWRDVESLFRALGAQVTQGAGSRVWVALNGVRACFHEPHPEKEIGKPAVRSVRQFLREAGEGL